MCVRSRSARIRLKHMEHCRFCVAPVFRRKLFQMFASIFAMVTSNVIFLDSSCMFSSCIVRFWIFASSLMHCEHGRRGSGGSLCEKGEKSKENLLRKINLEGEGDSSRERASTTHEKLVSEHVLLDWTPAAIIFSCISIRVGFWSSSQEFEIL